MIRCLFPTAACVVDVSLALNDAATPQASAVLPAFMLGIAVIGSLPLLIRASRSIVGLELPVEVGSVRRRQA